MQILSVSSLATDLSSFQEILDLEGQGWGIRFRHIAALVLRKISNSDLIH
jgi:hypothetical protein